MSATVKVRMESGFDKVIYRIPLNEYEKLKSILESMDRQERFKKNNKDWLDEIETE